MTHDDRRPEIDSRGMELVYLQVANDLEQRIRSGEYSHGDRLPSRDELAAEYGVAVMTVRRAQIELAGRGLVRIVSGKGTYVTLETAG